MAAKYSFGNPTPETSAPGTNAPTTSAGSFSFGGGEAVLFGSNPSATGLTSYEANTSAQKKDGGGGLFGSGGPNPTAGGGFLGSSTKSGQNLFRGAPASGPSGGGSLFGGLSTQGPAGLGRPGEGSAATPAKAPFTLNSTTPAGVPPPADTSKQAAVTPATGNLFGATSGGSGMFGNALSTGTNSATPAASGMGVVFGKPTPAATSTATPPAFGSFGGPGAAPKQGSFFGNHSPALSAAPAQAGDAAPKHANVFDNANGAATTSTAPATSAELPKAGLFGAVATPALVSTTAAAPAAMAAIATPKPGGGLFGPSTPAATSSAAPPALGLFGALPGGGLLGGSAATTTAGASTPTSAATTAGAGAGTAPAMPGFFGGHEGAEPAAATGASTDATTDASGAPPSSTSAATAAAAANGTASGTANNTLGASTSGPVSQISRLKNKTMDDIITRWASDLTKYQKEFKEQATQVAEWDMALVSNGDKIQKLYLDTFEAERASHEIERQLQAVESQQDELENWLNRYESEVLDMFSRQVGPTDQLTGPDQERERMYKLAEKLTQHLDERSRDLTKMVQEINDISGTISKSSKTEDPLSQIVRVLNSHLTQLQWIDVNAQALQAKVAAAQKSNAHIGHSGVGDNDAVEGFGRSWMGRR